MLDRIMLDHVSRLHLDRRWSVVHQTPLRGSTMPYTVVVVDDEHDVLTTLGAALEAEGFQVVCLDHPAKVVPAAQQDPPVVFLLDLMLPGMSGIELAHRLRAAGFSTTPMIALSASPLMLMAAEQSGIFHATLTKPFDLEELLATIEQSLPRDEGRS